MPYKDLLLQALQKIETPEPHCLKMQIAEESVIPQVVASLVQKGAQIVSLQQNQVSLEEIYFMLQNQQKEGLL
jgi:hypothetical protein